MKTLGNIETSKYSSERDSFRTGPFNLVLNHTSVLVRQWLFGISLNLRKIFILRYSQFESAQFCKSDHFEKQLRDFFVLLMEI